MPSPGKTPGREPRPGRYCKRPGRRRRPEAGSDISPASGWAVRVLMDGLGDLETKRRPCGPTCRAVLGLDGVKEAFSMVSSTS